MSVGTVQMNDASFASLSPTLLARKGGARPAMRPQHGGILGSIGPATGQNIASDESLDDLGWNDMGGEHAPRNDHDVIKLTPSPMHQKAAAQVARIDGQTDTKPAEFSAPDSASASPAREQQAILAKRIEKTSPPVLFDAIMANGDDADCEHAEQSNRVEEVEPGIDADHAAPQIPDVKTVRRARAHRVAAIDQGKRAAFTLRLDAERHLQLRLASTIGGRSAQQIVTDALDAFLAEMPELAALASQVKRPGTRTTTDTENSQTGETP